MIELIEQKRNFHFCNICQKDKKEKYYEIKFINPINQGIVVSLCESCLNDLTMKLLKKEVGDNDDRK